METLMVIIFLTFVPVKDSEQVEINYESRIAITTMDYCKKVAAALAVPVLGKAAIVICKKADPVARPNHYQSV